MLNWAIGLTSAAKLPENAVELAGEKLLGRHRLRIKASFATLEWPGEHPAYLVPCPADVTLGFGDSPPIALGMFPPDSESVICLASHGGTPGDLYWCVDLDAHQLQAIEDARDGRDVRLGLRLIADTYEGGRYRGKTGQGFVQYRTLNSQEWTSAVEATGFCDYLHFEIPIPRGEGVRVPEAIDSIKRAVAHRERGGTGHADAVAECRVALVQMGQAGFGKRLPKEISEWIGNEEERKRFDIVERLAVLQFGARLFFNALHHPDQVARDEVGRDHSNLGLALAASFLRLLPQHSPPDE